LSHTKTENQKNTRKSQKRPRDLKCNKMQHLSFPFFHRSRKKKPLRKLPVHTNINISITIYSTQNHITMRTTTTTTTTTIKQQQKLRTGKRNTYQSFVLSLHGQLTDFFSHRTTERRRSVTHRMDPRLFQKPNSSANLMRIGFSGRSSGR
jgi:hypothetical protein